ncbi:transporter substrate-binding domain-containing protein [Collinsella sp. zg1085]|uniref:transporter substrate-binding domain-containing protein n=1 Tax=Collinsella sp. zg1085 TaxID=2844380 RepID=UPI001C0A9539|nr:transporter substrate-binding domain-containing protein [Collinsella sp. zg1085]QWT17669.1 transporter substrate-binding domain-containing protein [Collinsella sp. zg1085]
MKKNMLRNFVAGVAALALSVGLVACSGGKAAESTNRSGADTAKDTSAAATGTLVVGFDQAYPPYGFVNDQGEFTGFDLDLAKAVADKLGWKLEYSPIDWDAKDTLLNSGAINAIWNGFTMEGREDGYSFSEPYMLNQQVVVVKKNAGIEKLADLAGKNVITQADSAAASVLEGDQTELAKSFAALETRPDYNTAFAELTSGATQAVACDLSIAQYQMAANPDAYFMIAEPLSSEHYAVGFKKGDTASAEQVSKTLKGLYTDGTVKQLCEKYASYGLSFENWVLK